MSPFTSTMRKTDQNSHREGHIDLPINMKANQYTINKNDIQSKQISNKINTINNNTIRSCTPNYALTQSLVQHQQYSQ
jgi:hypothetical protein